MVDRSFGYNYDWVDPNATSDLTCLICQFVAKEAHQTSCCGNIFCKKCIKTWSQYKATCPVCRADSLSIFEDKSSIRRINNLAVHCTNMKEGCNWKGELRDVIKQGSLANHLKDDCDLRDVLCRYCCRQMKQKELQSGHYDVCFKAVVRCSNSSCKVIVTRQNLSYHLTHQCNYRLVKCPNKCGEAVQYLVYSKHLKKECLRRMVPCTYCTFEGQYCIVKGEHIDTNCPGVPVDCLNKDRGCQEKIKRANQIKHLEVCRKEWVKCKYVGICMAVMKREDEHQHYKSCTDAHLMKTWMKLQEFEEDMQNVTASKLYSMENKLKMKSRKIYEIENILIDHYKDIRYLNSEIQYMAIAFVIIVVSVVFMGIFVVVVLRN